MSQGHFSHTARWKVSEAMGLESRSGLCMMRFESDKNQWHAGQYPKIWLTGLLLALEDYERDFAGRAFEGGKDAKGVENDCMF